MQPQVNHHAAGRAGGNWRTLLWFIAIGLSLTAIASAAPSARRLRVTLPITGSTDQTIIRMIERTLDESAGVDERPLLVLEFTPTDERLGGGSQFGRCLELARFLTGPKMARARTVAYLPRGVRGHALLVALACEEWIVAPDAVVGEAGIDETVLGPTVRAGYAEIARSRRTIPQAVALAMLDADLELLQVTTSDGVLYTWRDELPKIREQHANVLDVKTLVPAGTFARFRGEQLRDMKLASYLAADLQQLADALGVPADRLQYDPSLAGEWKPIRLQLTGPVRNMAVQRIIRTIEQHRTAGTVNLVLLEITTAGGDPSESVRLANYLAQLDPSVIRTVAYVPQEARADGMIAVYACDQIAAHPDAVLGGPGDANISPQQIQDLLPPIKSLALRKGRAWSLLMAMLDARVMVYRYVRAGTEQAVFLSPEEFRSRYGAMDDGGDRPPNKLGEEPVVANQGEVQQEGAPFGRWQRREAITDNDSPLLLSGQKAEQLGLIDFLVDDLQQLLQLYRLESTPELIGPNWALELIEMLASPQLAALLLFLGGFALMAELSSPGIGVGGLVAAVCFTLFFWANFLEGNAQVLELLLFLLGLGFVALEVLVIPGFGLFGLTGGALIVASLILASQTFVLPTNEYQLRQLPRSLLSLAAAMSGILAGIYAMQKYLHRTPVIGNIVLSPLDQEDQFERELHESMVDYRDLIGAVGRAQTQLAPSGKAWFADQLVDVITDGLVVDRGTEVRVIDASGNRVVVEPVQERPRDA